MNANLHTLCIEFRNAILQCSPIELSIGLRAFPLGACGDASLLLAKYLEENGDSGWQYVAGYDSGQSHAWLEKDNVLVDITADQFSPHLPGVIITTDVQWHSRFEVRYRILADFDQYDGYSKAVLRNDYQRILRNLTQ